MNSLPFCSVPGCLNGTKIVKNTMIYYRFPTNKNILQKWLIAINWPDGTPGYNHFVCEDHYKSKGLAAIDENTTILVPESIEIKQESELFETDTLNNNLLVAPTLDEGSTIPVAKRIKIENNSLNLTNAKEKAEPKILTIDLPKVRMQLRTAMGNKNIGLQNTSQPVHQESCTSSSTTTYMNATNHQSELSIRKPDPILSNEALSDEDYFGRYEIVSISKTKIDDKIEVPVPNRIELENNFVNVVPEKVFAPAVVPLETKQTDEPAEVTFDQTRHVMNRIRSDQKAKLFEFLEANQQEVLGYGNSAASMHRKALLWQQIATDLNKLDKRNRSVEQWKRAWQDLRKKVRKKMKSLRNLPENEEVPENLQLSSEDQKVAALCGFNNQQEEEESVAESTICDSQGPSSTNESPQPGPSNSTPPKDKLKPSSQGQALRARIRRAQIDEILPHRLQWHKQNGRRKPDSIGLASVVRQLELQETTVGLLQDIKALLTQLVDQGRQNK